MPSRPIVSDTGELTWIDAGNDPTDMDLSPNGTELMVVAAEAIPITRPVKVFSLLESTRMVAMNSGMNTRKKWICWIRRSERALTADS